MNYQISRIVLVLLISLLMSSCDGNTTDDVQKPNVVILYLDDLGYGDLSAYGATEINTPNIDQLANGGIRFTNGYASSATCTPSRYALLTGCYPWKGKDVKILPGTAPLIIDTAQMTLPKVLQSAGYHTGIVGKWHLGLGSGFVDWNKCITPGPNELGFDYSNIMAATQDRVPTVYIENGYVEGLESNDTLMVNYKTNFEGEPTGKDNPEMCSMMWDHGHYNSIVNGVPRIGFMKGGETAKWSDIDMADHFLEKAKRFVKNHKESPFFLYYALQQPHVPRIPHPRFAGSSGMGPRGDVIVEADWCIGEFIKTLESENLLDNTLIIFSSDNGPVLNDGYVDNAVEMIGNHKPTGGLRGGKYSLYEAGTRVPFIVYWKGRVQPQTSDALISQLDIMPSLAKLIDQEANNLDGEDMLDVFLGKSDKGRESLIIEASSRTALRQGDWILIPPYKGRAVNKYVNIELGNSQDYQLYNLSNDLEQKHNLSISNPEKLKELIFKYESLTLINKK